MTDRNRLADAGSRVRWRLAGDDRLVAGVRRGDRAAFEALYERHAGELMSFCVYMLGSRHDAEDVLQTTFASAYRALLADRRSFVLRPWLFTIARNDCLTVIRRRRPWAELNGEPALGPDPVRELELRDEVGQILEGLRELPERQRAALVMAELHGLSQSEIGTVLGVRAEQVKAYVYQARSNLISERRARDSDCREIREQIATARGASLLKGRLRKHLRSCDACRTYADGVAHRRQHLGALLPLAPSLALKHRAIEDAFTVVTADPVGYGSGVLAGGVLAGTAVEVAGGSVKALIVKVAAGIVAVGASAGVGASMLNTPGITREGAAVADAAPPHRAGGQPAAVTVGAGTVDLGGARSRDGGAGGPAKGTEEPAKEKPADDTSGADGGDGSHPAAGPGTDREAPYVGRGNGERQIGARTHGSAERVSERIERQGRRDSFRSEGANAHEQKQSATAERHSENAAARARARDEREKARSERIPEGHSKAPPSEAELIAIRERHEQRRSERLEKRTTEHEQEGPPPAEP